MANRYWVGGTGTWDTTTTTNWSTTSGGSGGASAPTTADAAIFNSLSGTGTITVNGTIVTNSITTTGSAFTFNNGGSATYSASGGGASVTIDTGTIFNLSITCNNTNVTVLISGTVNGNLVINSSVTGVGNTVTITGYLSGSLSGGVVSSMNIYASNIGGDWTIQSGGNTTLFGNVVVGGAVNTNNSVLTTGSYNLTCDNFIKATNGTVNSSGAGSIYVTGVNKTVVNLVINGSVTYGSKFVLSGNPTTGTRTVTGYGNYTPNAYISVSAGSDTVSLPSSLAGLNLTGFTGTWSNAGLTSNSDFILPAGVTVSGTSAVTACNGASGTLTIGQTVAFAITQGSSTCTLGSNITTTSSFNLTAGTLAMNGYNIVATSFNSNNSNTRAIQFGTNTITVNGTGAFWSTNSTGLTYTGTPTVNIANNSATASNLTATGATASNAFNFTVNTGTYTLTLNAGSNTFFNLNFTGFTGTLAGSGAYTVFGDLTLVAGMSYTNTGTLTFAAVSATKTLDTLGFTLGGFEINGSGLTVSLGSNVTTSGNFLITQGTLSAGARTVTSSSVTASILNTSGSTQTFYDVSFTSTAITTASITGNNVFNNLTIAKRASIGLSTVSFGGDQTVNGTFTAQSGGTDPSVRLFLNSTGVGTARTLTSASNSLFGIDFQDITAAGAASWNDSSRTNYWGNCGNNTNITFSTGRAAYWNLAGAQNWSATGWALTSTGTPATANFPLPQDTATFTDAGSTTGTITINSNWTLGSVDMSGRTSAMTLSNSTTSVNIIGNWTNGSGTTLSGTGAINFVGVSTQTITCAGKTFTQPFVINNAGGTVQQADTLTTTNSFTLTAGSYTSAGFTFSPVSLLLTGTLTRAITLSGTNNILGNNATVFNAGTVTGLTATIPSLNFTYSGATGTRTILNSTTLAFNLNVTAGTDIVTFSTVGGLINDMNFTGFSGTFSGATSQSFTGNWTVSTGMNPSYTGTLTYTGTSSKAFTTNSKTIASPLVINGVGGTLTPGGALTSTAAITLTNGTLDTQNNNLTCTIFALGAGTKTLTLGTSTVTLSSTGTVWDALTNVAGFTFSGASSTIVLSNTTTTARTFSGGGLTYGTLTIGGTTGISTTTINNSGGSFNILSSTKTVAHTILFPASTTTTISTWSVTGTTGNLVTVNSSTLGTAATLSITNRTSGIDYLDVADITANLAPVTFYAGANTRLRSNVQGVAAIAPIANRFIYVLNSGTSWAIPSNWNNANNEIHLFAGGGGGAGSRYTTPNGSGGAGGGGGGYTKATNVTLSGSVSYAIGAGGLAGAAGGDGGTGGSTTFKSGIYTAGGGGGGTGTTTTSTGGTAGTGSTANGGVGGQGSLTTVSAAAANGGGGGGGAGGPLGTGVAGGNGFAGGATVANCAGGGGGGNGGGSAGGNAGSATGGTGGNNNAGVGGGATATAGFSGGGSGGVVNAGTGLSGSSGVDIATAGIGGGGGAGGIANSATVVANPAFYGAGGGGGGSPAAGTQSIGMVGAQGGIVIVYEGFQPIVKIGPGWRIGAGFAIG